MSFCQIPGGSFRMGSHGEYGDEEPVHWVTVREFWMGETPVTQKQYRVWTESEGLEHRNVFSGSDDLPAENMDWRKANRYCAWLTEVIRPQMDGDWKVCLPTEAEWEYACRAGSETEYWSGDGEEALKRVGWYNKNSDKRTQPVGKLEGNRWGLKDMHGNVREWCHDVWEESGYRHRVDGDGDAGREAREWEWGQGLEAMLQSVLDRVRRGGSWSNSARFCRSASRFRWMPADEGRDAGFRVCLVPVPSVPEAGGGAGTGRRNERDAREVGPSEQSRGALDEEARALSGLGMAHFPRLDPGDPGVTENPS